MAHLSDMAVCTEILEMHPSTFLGLWEDSAKGEQEFTPCSPALSWSIQPIHITRGVALRQASFNYIRIFLRTSSVLESREHHIERSARNLTDCSNGNASRQARHNLAPPRVGL